MSSPTPPPPPGYGTPPPPPPGYGTPPPPPPHPPGYGTPPPPPGYGVPGTMPPYGSPYGTAFRGPRNLAGFWHRLGGHLLDGLLYGLVAVPFVVVGVVLIAGSLEDCDRFDRFDGTTEISCGPGQLKGGLLAAGIVVLVIALVVVAFMYLRALARTGQTWGKRIAGLKVVKQVDGSPPGWGKAIGRSLFKSTISGWICWLGFLWMLWDSNKQTWHDKVAGTLVIRV